MPTKPISEANRRVGAKARELRVAAGLKQREVAEQMRTAGFPQWDVFVVNAVQAGTRHLTVAELAALAAVFGVTSDELLAGSLDAQVRVPKAPVPARRVGVPSSKPSLAALGQSERLPGWPPAPGQKEDLDAFAEALNAPRAKVLRAVVAAGLGAAKADPALLPRLLKEIG